ncbi:hypothetical protein [Lysinibacillus sp. Bpr_S20]|uniref:hypothetical protein n=1 Tax=Lysinibacillus sp. Bpr_S20 TaxID=2933964 RepID=UPI002011F259|nr:hypothetical protein [Lysinibacillus sp. Bpr_S20]MCL1700755.1 hypothetical protein [Lysinibacillus sp. Bpr_S20]
MEYFSKLDNKSFTTKETLIDHLVKNYSMKVEKSDYTDIIDKINKAAPYVSVNSINKDSKDMLIVSISYHNKQGNYLHGEEIVLEGGAIQDYDYWDYMVCKDTDGLISYITSYYNKADLIESILIDKFGMCNDSFELMDIHTGGHDSNAAIYFKFYIDDIKYERRYDFGDSDDDLFNQINSLFVKEIEGVIENRWNSCSHSQIFRVSGVDVNEFLKDGKKVKIEILD